MKTNKARFPITVKKGSAAVKIYKSTSKGYDYFKIAYYLGGKRKTQNFPEFEAAKREAEIQAGNLSRGDIEGALLSGKDRLVYCRALEAVSRFNIPLDAVAIDYAEAKKILGGVALSEAARFYVRHHSEKITPKTVREIVDEMIAAKKEQGLSLLYTSDLKYRCGAFANAFQCPLNTVAANEIREFLNNLKLSPRSYNNFFGAIGTLFSYAKSRFYIAKDNDVLDGLEKRKDKGGEIEVFTPGELSKLLSHASEDLVPILTIGAFAGLRTEEILRLEWKEIHLADKFIEITAEKAKTASRRLAPVTENLTKWLGLSQNRSGKVWPHSKAYLYEAFSNAARDAKLEWKHNALRHSFISYRVANIQDMNKVALEAGNSPQIIFKSYRELVRPADAEKWFSIVPTGKLNVVSLPKQAEAA